MLTRKFQSDGSWLLSGLDLSRWNRQQGNIRSSGINLAVFGSPEANDLWVTVEDGIVGLFLERDRLTS
jgi:hypothetical protein